MLCQLLYERVGVINSCSNYRTRYLTAMKIKANKKISKLMRLILCIILRLNDDVLSCFFQNCRYAKNLSIITIKQTYILFDLIT